MALVWGKGPVSRLKPGARLLCLLICSAGVFFMCEWRAALIGCLFLALLLWEGISASTLRRDFGFLLFLCFANAFFSFLGLAGSTKPDFSAMLMHILTDSLRLISSFEAGRLFYLTTSPLEAREAALSIVHLAPRHNGAGRNSGQLKDTSTIFALLVFLVLSLIPRILAEWRDSLEAAKARGLRLSIRKPGPAADLLAAYLRRLALMSMRLPDALAARAWRAASGNSVRSWSVYDFAGCLGILAGILCLILL